MSRMPTTYLAVALLCLASATLADVTGVITGVVSDQSGGVIPNVEVTVTNTGTNATFRATSSEQGVFTLNTLPVGTYNLSAATRGFKKFEAQRIRLQVNEVVRVDVALAVGETAETVRSEERRVGTKCRYGWAVA